MARRREKDVIITISALVAATLLIILLQSTPVEQPSAARVAREAASDEEDSSDAQDECEGTAVCVCPDTCDQNCDECAGWGRSYVDDDYEEGPDGKKGKKRKPSKNKAVALTMPQKVTAMETFRNQAVALAMRAYNRRNSDFDIAVADAQPASLTSGVAQSVIDTYALLNSDIGSDKSCLSNPQINSANTRQVIIAYPITYDWVSSNKDDAHANMVRLIDNVAQYAKSMNVNVKLASYYGSVVQRFVSYTDQSSIEPLTPRTQYPQSQYGKLFNSFEKQFGKMKPALPSNQNQNRCFMVLIINDLPRDYINILTGAVPSLKQTISRCTIIPVFRDGGSADLTKLQKALVPHLVPGTSDFYSHDDKTAGFYFNSAEGSNADQDATVDAISNGIKSYMCLVQDSLFCALCAAETAPPSDVIDTFNPTVTTAAAGTTTETSTTDTPADFRELDDLANLAGAAAIPDDPLPRVDECCGAYPYLQQDYDSAYNQCCIDSLGGGVVSALGEFNSC